MRLCTQMLQDSSCWQTLRLTVDSYSASQAISVYHCLNGFSFTLQAVYSVLKEAEHRSTFYIPYWSLPLAMQIVPRQRKFTKNLKAS